MSPGRRQAIMWTNAGISSPEPQGTNYNEILIKIHTFSFKKMHLKRSSVKWRPFCLSLNVLEWQPFFKSSLTSVSAAPLSSLYCPPALPRSSCHRLSLQPWHEPIHAGYHLPKKSKQHAYLSTKIMSYIYYSGVPNSRTYRNKWTFDKICRKTNSRTPVLHYIYCNK